jgi:hypothetical protein
MTHRQQQQQQQFNKQLMNQFQMDTYNQNMDTNVSNPLLFANFTNS